MIPPQSLCTKCVFTLIPVGDIYPTTRRAKIRVVEGYMNQAGQFPEERIAISHVVLIASMHFLAVAALFVPSRAGLLCLLVMHVITGLGVTIGYHRLLSHGAVKTSPFIRGVFALFGTLSLQGGPLLWVTFHRAHHLWNEDRRDPHSSARGFLWSHLLWMFYKNPNGFSQMRSRTLVRDLSSSSWLKFLDKNAMAINLTAAAIFFVIFRRMDLLLWAFPLRIVVLWHCAWLVNSYCHRASLVGKERKSILRNSFLVAMIGYGEGWHQNHHLRPDSANFQHKWWQIDPGWMVIRILEISKLAKRNYKTRSGKRLGQEFRGKRIAA